MSAGFWLSERACSAIESLLPTNPPGARRVDACRDQNRIERAFCGLKDWQIVGKTVHWTVF